MRNRAGPALKRAGILLLLVCGSPTSDGPSVGGVDPVSAPSASAWGVGGAPAVGASARARGRERVRAPGRRSEGKRVGRDGVAAESARGAAEGRESGPLGAPAAPGAASLRLLGVQREGSRPETRVLGTDLEAPRPLVLWQRDPRSLRAAPLAFASSRSDGLLVVERLLLPTRGVQLVVTPAQGDPRTAPPGAVLVVPEEAP